MPQLMIRQQDETIDTIAGTLNTIHEQAGLMGREIVEHNECVHVLIYASNVAPKLFTSVFATQDAR